MEELHRNIVPEIAIKLPWSDIISLCMTSKRLNTLICNNDNFWRQKMAYDYDIRHKLPEYTWRQYYSDYHRMILYMKNVIHRLYAKKRGRLIFDDIEDKVLESPLIWDRMSKYQLTDEYLVYVITPSNEVNYVGVDINLIDNGRVVGKIVIEPNYFDDNFDQSLLFELGAGPIVVSSFVYYDLGIKNDEESTRIAINGERVNNDVRIIRYLIQLNQRLLVWPEIYKLITNYSVPDAGLVRKPTTEMLDELFIE